VRRSGKREGGKQGAPVRLHRSLLSAEEELQTEGGDDHDHRCDVNEKSEKGHRHRIIQLLRVGIGVGVVAAIVILLGVGVVWWMQTL